jgi:hypothetical protein
MPTYDLRNKKTDEVKEFFNIPIKKMEELTGPDGEWTQVLTVGQPIITNNKSMLTTAGGDWQNKLDQIKKGSGRRNTINS